MSVRFHMPGRGRAVRSRRRLRLFFLVAAGAALGTAGLLGAPGGAPSRAASAERWTITDIGASEPWTTGGASAINERGQVVGWGEFASGESPHATSTHAVLWEEGRRTDLGTLPLGSAEQWSGAGGINERGEVVGVTWPLQPDTQIVLGLPSVGHGFVWASGEMRELGDGVASAWAMDQEISSLPVAINDAGQIAGIHATAGKYAHAVRWTNGRATDLGTLPRRPFSEATALNERGWVVGIAYAMPRGPKVGAVRIRGFVWRGGKLLALRGVRGGAPEAWPSAINDRGQIVGRTCCSTPQRAFLWQKGRTIDLGTLRGHTRSAAVGINERGQVVGTSSGSRGSRAFLWQNGRMIDLGTLGGRFTVAVAINERGQVIGTSTTAREATHAFVWQKGRMTDLGTLGGPHSWVAEINNRGRIVGTSQTADEFDRPVLWTPRADAR